MSESPRKSGVAPLQRAIDHYFEVAIYLLVITGFSMLAATGGLDMLSMVVVGGAFIVRGYFLARRRKLVISDRWTTPLSLAYLLFFTVDYFLFSRGFLPATVHLALFGVVIRMFSVRRERDYITLSILAFLMVLASAVLTVNSIFLFSFAAFMLMAVLTFVLMEMRRSGQSANIVARYSADPQEHRRFAFALARVAPLLMVMILLGGAMLFFLIPRISAGYLGGYAFGNDLSSGFSEHVRLGQIGEIQQSNAIVMHVQIDGDATGEYELHWRGISLANFDGHSWSNPPEQFILQRAADDSFPLPRSLGAMRYGNALLPRERLIHYRVLMEPIGTNVFFLAPWARSIRGDYRLLAGDLGGAVYDFDPRHSVSRYEATSDLATALPRELRTAGQNYPSAIAETFLSLPPLDPRIGQLAAEITKSGQNSFDKAAAIDTYLRTHYAYTLQLPRRAEQDPIADFLFVRKQGHCEYFASAMAVMLRTIGIPSRVVNGFRSDEFNDVTDNYIIRAKNAHSWVEAYFPGYGWQMFDPTPGGGGGTPQGWARVGLYVDAMASFWRDWVVSYDSTHQFILGQTAINGTRGLWEKSRGWAREKYISMLHWAGRNQNRVEHAPARWAVVGAGVAVLLLLLANLGRLVGWVHERWVRAHPDKSPEQAAAMWYRKMAHAVARRGVEKTPGQTPQEFVKRIPDARLREPVSRFTAVYESARFGNSVDDAQRLPELYEEVVSAAAEKT